MDANGVLPVACSSPSGRGAAGPGRRLRHHAAADLQRGQYPGADRDRRRPDRAAGPRAAAEQFRLPEERRDPPVSVARRREVIDALRRGTVPSRPRPARGRLDRFDAAVDDELDSGRRRRRRLQGGARRVRLRQDLLRPLARRAGQAGGFATAEVQISETETRCTGWRPSTAGSIERLTTADSSRRARCGRSSTAGSTPWRRTSSPRATVDRGRRRRRCDRAVDELLEQRLADVSRDHARVRRRAARLPRGAGARATRPTADGAARLARRAAARRRRGPAGRRRQGRPRPLRRARLPPGPAHRPARLRATPGCCWCSTRSRPCSGSAATSGRRRSTRCASSSTRSTPAASPACTCVITGTPAFFDGPQGVQRLPPLAQRLATDFAHRPPLRQPAGRPDPPARLRPSTRCVELGGRVRDLYADGTPTPRPDRAARRRRLRRRPGRAPSPASSAARSASPRGCSCKKLVADVLDRVDQFADFDPRAALRADRRRRPS